MSSFAIITRRSRKSRSSPLSHDRPVEVSEKIQLLPAGPQPVHSLSYKSFLSPAHSVRKHVFVLTEGKSTETTRGAGNSGSQCTYSHEAFPGGELAC